ncbi:tRNA lysidine(34) synthetase TilS [Pseudoalteromonas mariniglutinosa]|uniref:tRNA lysidine(34) synthetase TilS n=1 Tax=Pseudoalteromonas mariniglutinosa TaxID=206042 RepID=UPI00384D9710
MHTSQVYQHVKQAIAPYLEKGKNTFTVALSGGVDSVVLLHVMDALKAQHSTLTVHAVYVNHGLSEYANDWQQFCQQLCDSLQIPFQAVSVIITQKPRSSLEALAREARYQALDQTSIADSILLLGQHLNDQLETFLLRLKRGSGLQGLASMRQTRTLPSGRLCMRPLLEISREEIEQFATRFKLEHITDDSNTDERFDRNFIRKHVVTKLNERFSGFTHSAARSILLLQQQHDLLNEYCQVDLMNSQNSDQGLRCASLQQFSKIRQANVLRCWLAQFTTLMPSKKQLEQILLQGLTAQADAQLQIQLQAGQVKRHQGHLYFVTNTVQAQPQSLSTEQHRLSDGRKLVLKQGKGIREPHHDEQVTVKFNCPLARIRPLYKPGSNTVKHWLKEAKVAPWLRANVPLIFYDQQLVQVVGYFVSAEHQNDSGIFWEVER